MTSTATTQSPSLTQPHLLPVAAATFLGTSVFTALGVFGDGTAGATRTSSEFLVIVGVSAAATAVVFGLVVPRLQESRRAAAVGLGLSLTGLLLVLVFWSGLTPPLAVGGIVLGAMARRTGHRPGLGGVAIAVGAFALVGYIAIYVLDWLSTNNVAGF